MAQQTTKPDGTGIPRKIDEIVIRGAKGNQNPRITEDQLRKIIERNPNAANQPLPGAANDGPLEEVKVTGKRPVNAYDLAKFLLSLLRKGGIGAIGMYNYPDWLLEALQSAENDITQETLRDDEDVQDALRSENPDASILEEVYPETEKVDPTYSTGVEEVLVTAKRLRNGHLQTVEFPWRFIEQISLGKPVPFVAPGYRPTEEYPIEPYKTPAPGKPPKINPTTDPAQDDALVPTGAQNPSIEGSLAITVNPSTGVRLSIRRRPARNREENRLRRDRKDEKASRMYRQVLYLVNKTYGEVTELQDLWQAIAQNIYINGRPLNTFKNPAEALKNASDWTVDWEQMIIDYAAMELTDKGIGKLSRTTRGALNEMGYYGPNPGSYAPKPPTGP